MAIRTSIPVKKLDKTEDKTVVETNLIIFHFVSKYWRHFIHFKFLPLKKDLPDQTQIKWKENKQFPEFLANFF